MNKNKFENKIIQVCDACFTAACWQGAFLCQESRDAGIVKKTVKELRALGQLENEEFWSDEKLEESFGDPAPDGYAEDDQ